MIETLKNDYKLAKRRRYKKLQTKAASHPRVQAIRDANNAKYDSERLYRMTRNHEAVHSFGGVSDCPSCEKDRIMAGSSRRLSFKAGAAVDVIKSRLGIKQ